MRRREFLMAADDGADALRMTVKAVENHTKNRKWRYLIEPEVMKYTGRSKVLRGKWRCYARIEYW